MISQAVGFILSNSAAPTRPSVTCSGSRQSASFLFVVPTRETTRKSALFARREWQGRSLRKQIRGTPPTRFFLLARAVLLRVPPDLVNSRLWCVSSSLREGNEPTFLARKNSGSGVNYEDRSHLEVCGC